MRAKFSIGSSQHGSRREESSSSRVGWATGGKIRWTIKGFAFSIHTHFFMQVHSSCDTGKSKNGQKWFNLFRAQWEGKFISRLLQNFLRLSRTAGKKQLMTPVAFPAESSIYSKKFLKIQSCSKEVFCTFFSLCMLSLFNAGWIQSVFLWADALFCGAQARFFMCTSWPFL